MKSVVIDANVAGKWFLAVTTQGTVYDSMYVALAFQQDTACITADERLVNAMAPTPFRRNIRLLSSRL